MVLDCFYNVIIIDELKMSTNFFLNKKVQVLKPFTLLIEFPSISKIDFPGLRQIKLNVYKPAKFLEKADRIYGSGRQW